MHGCSNIRYVSGAFTLQVRLRLVQSFTGCPSSYYRTLLQEHWLSSSCFSSTCSLPIVRIFSRRLQRDIFIYRLSFPCSTRKGREHKTNLELLADYLDSRDAFDAELAALEPSLNRSVRSTGPVVPLEHQQALIMLMQEFTEEQVNELEDFLLDTVGLELDENEDLILDFSAVSVDKLHTICEHILKLSTQDQQKVAAHRVHVLKTLIVSMK